MASLDTINYDALFSMFKGEPGTRKSTSALSYPRPQYWFSTDQKMEAMALPASKWNIPFKDIQFDDYSDYGKIEAKLKQFESNCPFKTIVLDSVTSTGDNINRQTKTSKADKSNKDGGDAGLSIAGIRVNTMQDYKAEAAAFQEIIARLKDIHKYFKIHVILIAHVIGQRKSDENNNLTHHSRIIVTGGDKISAKLPAYCTEVYHFQTKGQIDTSMEPKFEILTGHTGNDFARTSLAIPRSIEFNDKPLYENWVRPAIDKLKAVVEENKPKPTTTTTLPTNKPSMLEVK